MDFVSVDVETANPDVASICQVGVAVYKDGQLSKEWTSLVDPEDFFYGINVSIHGIDEEKVRGAPTFPQIAENVRSLIGSSIAVCHTQFDRAAFSQAFEKHKLPPLECTWLDSARVARRAWEAYAYKGYGLSNLCKDFGYDYQAHDALEDAKAAGFVLLKAVKEVGLSPEEWLKRVRQPINLTSSAGTQKKLEGNPDGQLYGEVIVFTGALTIPRKEAAALAAKTGCTVLRDPSKKTTLLVVGDQDVTKLAGHSKSSKHRKVEALIEKGADIRILRETDFMRLVELYS